MVVGAAVVVVDTLLQVVVVNEEVVPQLAPRHLHGRLPSADGGEERLAVPRVERSVVTTLTARREDEVLLHKITSTHAVVEVDSGAWALK